MPEINSLRKSIVDVALGALAFLCSVDRTGIPITRTLAVLVFCIVTWVLLAVGALSSSLLIGGSSPEERFSELAPVLVLSCPMLWAALRRVQMILETYDSLLGALTLAQSYLKTLRGVFDDQQAFRRSRSLHLSVHALKEQVSRHPFLYTVRRRVHFGGACSSSRCVFNEFGARGPQPTITAEFAENIAFHWTTELLPLGDIESLFLPRQLFSEAFFTEIYSNIAEHIERRDLTSGLVSKLSYCLRWIIYRLRCVFLRFPPRASVRSIHVSVDNVKEGFVFTAKKLNFLLRLRRAALRWPAAAVKLIQGIVSTAISSFDATVGETGGLAIVALMEAAHPLELRRENAIALIFSKCAVVGNIDKHRDHLQRIGHMPSMNSTSQTILVRYILTVFKGRSELASRAFIMLHVGHGWRCMPRNERSKRGRHKVVLNDISEESLPEIAQGQVTFMLAPPNNRNPSSIDIEWAYSGKVPMIALSRCVMSAAESLGLGVCSRLSGIVFSGLMMSEDHRVLEAKRLCLSDFCENGWLTSTLPGKSIFNAVDSSLSVEMCERLDEMEKICMDCHAAALLAYLGRRQFETSEMSATIRHRHNEHYLNELIVKVDQHELLVACHRNEVKAVAWMFVDQTLEGEWGDWHKWCVSDALDLCSDVFSN